MLKGKSTSVIKHNAKMFQSKGVKQADAIKSALSMAGQGKGKKIARKVAKGDEVPDRPMFKAKVVQQKHVPTKDAIDPDYNCDPQA